ncbi:MAG TPA: MFS transporter [Reyranella sp.]
MSPNSPAESAASPWRPLLPVFAACGAIGLQVGVALPLVPLALERQGADKLTIGVVAAAWAIGMLATASHIPRLAARFGAVPFIIAAVLAGSAITVAYTLTDSVIAWFVLTFLHGVVGGVPWVVSEIWMNVVVEEKHRGRVMGVYAMLVAFGLALGPFVLQVVGVYGPAPFLTSAALALLVAVPLLPYWKTAPQIEHPADSGYTAVIVGAPLAMLAAFACGLGEQVAFSFLPVYAVGAGVSAQTGALWLSAFVIGNVILQWPIGCMADHFDRRAVLAGCTLASAILVALLPAVSAQSPIIAGVIMLWGGLSFAIYPVGLALLGQRFGGGDIARANTAFSMLYILGGLVGRPLAGAAMDAVGDPGLGWTLALFYSIAAVAALLAFHRRG